MSYCGSEMGESEIYSPYSFCGSEAGADVAQGDPNDGYPVSIFPLIFLATGWPKIRSNIFENYVNAN
jgi:hypothetical protein